MSIKIMKQNIKKKENIDMLDAIRENTIKTGNYISVMSPTYRCNSNYSKFSFNDLPTEASIMSEKKKKSVPKSVKIAIWNKHIGEEIGKTKCLCCKTSYITQMNFYAGHIISTLNGGLTNVNNLLPICSMCNTSIGTMNLYEFKNKYFPDKIPIKCKCIIL